MKDQVPTPFKKALFWPDEIKSNNKRKKEKIPSAITSEKWQEYHKKKQIEKNKKVEEKIKKAGERKRKKGGGLGTSATSEEEESFSFWKLIG